MLKTCIIYYIILEGYIMLGFVTACVYCKYDWYPFDGNTIFLDVGGPLLTMTFLILWPISVVLRGIGYLEKKLF